MRYLLRFVVLSFLCLHGINGYASGKVSSSDSLKYLSYSNSRLLSQARKAATNDVYDEAKTMYLILLQRDSINPLYNYECGLNFFLNLFEQPLSLPYFERTIKYSGKDTITKAFYYLGQAYQLNNRYEEATKAYLNYKRFISKNKSELADLEKKIQQCQQGKGYLATFNNIVNIDNVGNNVNTEEAEYVPVVKGDESVMYFTARRKSNVGGELDQESNRFFEDMFISKGENGVFHVGERFSLGDTLTKKLRNTGAHESVVSLSYDEKYLITYKNNSLWYSEWISNSWSKPIRFGKNINRGEYQNHGSLSAGNDSLFFSSNASEGYGGMDIYLSVKNADGKWGKAQNLGATINTSDDEDSPSIAFDNNTLYFSSKGHNSMGGFDVYKSVYKDGQWSTPLNLGMPVNSSGDDIYFKYDKNKKQAYFSSSRQKGFGDYDIYRLIDYNSPRFDDCQYLNALPAFPISIDAASMAAPKMANLDYRWEFDDGKQVNGEKVDLNFTEPGEHKVKLYVLDPIASALVYEKDTIINVLNFNTPFFNSPDTVSIDSLIQVYGTPKNIDDSKVLKYNWNFGDSTAILDSSAASHNYKAPGNYEVKLSMVAMNDSTDRIFQKCVTKNVTVLNKEDYMNYYLKSVVRANKRKGFNSDMLGLTHLEFLAPDTSTLSLENLFDASPVFIPNSKILSYNWNFGDTLKRIKTTQIKHAFDSVKIYEVKLNVVYQNDSTKGIYEQSVKKNVVVVSPEDYQKIQSRKDTLARKSFETTLLDKSTLDFIAPDTTTLNLKNIFNSQPVKIADSKILEYKWTIGDSVQKVKTTRISHAFDSLGSIPVKLDITYQNNKSKGIYETTITKNVTVIDTQAFKNVLLERFEKLAEASKNMQPQKPELEIIAPDTTTLNLLTEFKSVSTNKLAEEPVKSSWNFGDTAQILSGTKTNYSFKDTGSFPVVLDAVFQNAVTGKFEKSKLQKSIEVLDTATYKKLVEARAQKQIAAKNPEFKATSANQFNTDSLPSIELENIYFDYDKFTIRPDAKEALLRNITKLGIDTLLAIKVSANTDSRGSQAYNFKLSAKRAISAINFMAAHNIARERIIAVVSLGETNLVNNCGDRVKCNEKQHQLNRRDEFKVVGRVKK